MFIYIHTCMYICMYVCMYVCRAGKPLHRLHLCADCAFSLRRQGSSPRVSSYVGAICGDSSSSRTSASYQDGAEPCTYNACCWGGARSKKQALESNVAEIDELRCSCHHTHSRSEWTPYRASDGSWKYPSTGEAEYTADLAFAIAVALSWWAVRTGDCTFLVPWSCRMQATGTDGRICRRRSRGAG